MNAAQHTGPRYLETVIVEAKRVYPRHGAGMTHDGYTSRRGAPSSLMIRLQGEKIWRRVMVWQFSNAGTCFVRVKGACLIVREYEIPEVPSERAARLAREVETLQQARKNR